MWAGKYGYTKSGKSLIPRKASIFDETHSGSALCCVYFGCERVYLQAWFRKICRGAGIFFVGRKITVICIVCVLVSIVYLNRMVYVHIYRVAKTHGKPQVVGHFPQKSH